MTPFSQFLQKLRRSRSLKQKDLASLIGVKPCYVSIIERGRVAAPSKAVLDKNRKVSKVEQI